MEIPADATGTGASIQTIYRIQTTQPSNPNEIHLQQQQQYSPVVLAPHQSQAENPDQYQQQFYEETIIVEDKEPEPSTSNAHMAQQVVYQTQTPQTQNYKNQSQQNAETLTPEQKLQMQREKRAARARDR